MTCVCCVMQYGSEPVIGLSMMTVGCFCFNGYIYRLTCNHKNQFHNALLYYYIKHQGRCSVAKYYITT